MGMTARLLARVNSSGRPSTSSSTTFAPAMLDPNVDGERRVGADLSADEFLTVPANRHERRAGAAPFHDDGADRLVAADDAEPRRLQQLDLPVAFIRPTGDEHVEGGAESEALDRGRDVVHDAVGYEDHAGEPLRRHIGETVRERGEQTGSVVAGAVIGLDVAGFHVGHRAKAALQLSADLLGHGQPVAERLRSRAIDDDRDDILDLLAFLLDQRRIGQRQHDETQRKGAEQRDRTA